jgi:hypothetical protein
MNPRREARRRWRQAIWIIGGGEYASVAHCHPGATVMLLRTRMEAEIAKGAIDDTGCGGRCSGQHEIVYLGKGRGCPPIPRDQVISELKRRGGQQ